jgi:hypothetical protein
VNAIQTVLLNLLPHKRKQTGSGWTSFNAICCHHRAHGHDKRLRGGIKIQGDSFVYNCFNCGFRAGWQPGKNLTKNCQLLLTWLGLDKTQIDHLKLQILKNPSVSTVNNQIINLYLAPKPLPNNSMSIIKWLEANNTDPDLLDCIEYIFKRKLEIDWCDWHWSPLPEYRRRIIIPFTYDNQIVGWTARNIDQHKQRYLSSAQPSYVFNIDHQSIDRQYVIIVEGVLDAVALDAVSVMGRTVNASQAARINSLGKQVIVVPDRDRDGIDLIKAAIQNNWSISIPPWHEDIKDVADAQAKYGRIYTLWSILSNIVSNPVKQKIILNQLQNRQK